MPDLAAKAPETSVVRQPRWLRWLIAAGAVPIVMSLALFVVLPALHVGRVYSTATKSMSPTLEVGDYIYSNQLAYRNTRPARGDLVVVDVNNWQVSGIWVRRIAGVPGDVISVQNSTLMLNGRPLHSPIGASYQLISRSDAALLRDTDSLTVPPDSYFVLGDNEPHSFDSRHHGMLPRGKILGRVSFRLWPFARIGSL